MYNMSWKILYKYIQEQKSSCWSAACAAERERDALRDAWNRLCERGHKSIEGTALTDKAGLQRVIKISGAG